MSFPVAAVRKAFGFYLIRPVVRPARRPAVKAAVDPAARVTPVGSPALKAVRKRRANKQNQQAEAAASQEEGRVPKATVHVNNGSKSVKTKEVLVDGKINLARILRDYQAVKALLVEKGEPDAVLDIDATGYSVFAGFESGKTYHIRVVRDPGYDVQVSFSHAVRDDVIQHFNLDVGQQGSWAPVVAPQQMTAGLVEALTMWVLSNTGQAETSRRSVISLLLTYASVLTSGRAPPKLAVQEEMTFSWVQLDEESGLRVRYNGPLDFSVGHLRRENRLRHECAFVLVEAKTGDTVGDALGQVLAQAATIFNVRRAAKRGGTDPKVFWCLSDGELWRMGYIRAGQSGELEVREMTEMRMNLQSLTGGPGAFNGDAVYSALCHLLLQALDSSPTTSLHGCNNASPTTSMHGCTSGAAELALMCEGVALAGEEHTG